MENNVQTQQVPENLTPQQALGLLVQGIHFAQSKGVFTLKDAALLDKAVSLFATDAKQEVTDEVSKDSAEPVNATETLVDVKA